MQVSPRNIPVITTTAPTVVMMGAAACQVKDFAGQDLGADFEALVANMKSEDYLIVAGAGLREAIGEECYNAIILHEEGHCVLGHLEIIQSSRNLVNVNGTEIINNEQFELEADQYAACRIGADTMKKALKDSVSFIVDKLMEHFESNDEEVRSNATAQANQSIQYRLVALETLA